MDFISVPFYEDEENQELFFNHEAEHEAISDRMRAIWKERYYSILRREGWFEHLHSDWLETLDNNHDYGLFLLGPSDHARKEVYRTAYGKVSFKPLFCDWIFSRQRSLCGYCGKIVSRESQSNWAIDHMLPKSRGGDNMPPNLMLACWSCNSAKKDKTVKEFRHMIMTKQSPAYGLITRRKIEELQHAGIDMKMPNYHRFVFEWLGWKHVWGNEG